MPIKVEASEDAGGVFRLLLARSGRSTLGGLLVNLANPKSVLFAAAVLVVIFPPGLTWDQQIIIVANHMLVEIIAYTGFALVLSRQSVRERYVHAKPVLDRISACILGVRLMLDR